MKALSLGDFIGILAQCSLQGVSSRTIISPWSRAGCRGARVTRGRCESVDMGARSSGGQSSEDTPPEVGAETFLYGCPAIHWKQTLLQVKQLVLEESSKLKKKHPR